MAVSSKHKRKFEFKGQTYYWFVRIESDGSHRIHILSDDKKFNQAFSMPDTELSITPSYIRRLLEQSGVPNKL